MIELCPITPKAKRWVSMNLKIEDWQRTKNGILYDDLSWQFACASLDRQAILEGEDYIIKKTS